MRCKEDVIMSGVGMLFEQVRSNVPSQVIIAPGREMTGAEHLLVLNIGS